MSISRVSPLVGYFVTKLLDTTVFQNIFKKIKTGVGSAISSVAGKAKDIISLKKKEEEPAKASPLKRALPEVKEIPHLQTGGYIEKGGLARVHPAEVVAPIEDVLDRIDKSAVGQQTIFSGIKKILSIAEIRSARLENVVMKDQKEKMGLVDSFVNAVNMTFGRQAPIMEQSVASMREIQKSLTGTIFSWRQVSNQMIANNKMLKGAVLTFKSLRTTLGVPWKGIYSVFKGRGGYEAHLPKGASSINNQTKIEGMTYTLLGYRTDEIIFLLKNIYKVMKIIGTGITGQKIDIDEDFSTKRWSIFSKGMSALSWSVSKIAKKDVNLLDYVKFWKKKDEKKEKTDITQQISLISTLEKLADAIRIFKERPLSAPGSRGVIDNKKLTELEQVRGYYRKSGTWVEPYTRRKRVKAGEKTLEENMSTIVIDVEAIKDTTKKSLKGQKEQISILEKMKSRLLKWGKSLWKWLLFGLTFIKDIVFKAGNFLLGSLGHVIGPVIGGIVAKSLGGLGKAVSSIGTFFTKGGFTGVMGRLLKGPLQAIGLIIEGIGGWKKAKEWFGEKATTGEKAASAAGAVLGGTTSGWKGAAWGALKGAGVGAAVGSIVPIFGTGIGAAIGALTGSIMGFIGGEKTAKAIVAMGKYIKKFVTGVWNFITWPTRVTLGAIKKAWTWMKSLGSKAMESAGELKKAVSDYLLFPFRFIKDKVLSVISNIFGGVWKAVQEIYIGFAKGALEIIKGIGSGLWKAVASVGTMIKGIFTGDIDTIKKGVGGLIGAIFTAVWGVIKGVGKIITGVGKAAYRLVEGVGKAAWEVMTAPAEFVKEMLAKLKGIMFSAFSSGWKFITGLFKKEEKTVPEKAAKVVNTAKEKVGDISNNTLSIIATATKATTDQVKDIQKKGISKDIVKKTKDITEATKNIASGTIDDVGNSLFKLKDIIKEKIDKEDIKKTAEKVVKNTKDVSTGIISSISNNTSKVASIVKKKTADLINSSPIIIKKTKELSESSVDFVDTVLEAAISQLSKIQKESKKFIEQLEPSFEAKLGALKARMGAGVEFVRPVIINKASIIASEGMEKATEVFTNLSDTKDMIVKGAKRELAGFELVAKRAGENTRETVKKIGESGQGIASSMSNVVSTVISSNPTTLTTIQSGGGQGGGGMGIIPSFVTKVVDGDIN